MNIGRELYLKWIDLRSAPTDLDQVFTNLCVVTVQSPDRLIQGFTIFEPRSLNPDFIDRLEKRMALPNYAQHSFALNVPPFLRHRLETLIKGFPRERLDVRYTPFVHIQLRANYFLVRTALRVINVDDSPVLLKLLRHCLTNMGFIDIVAQITDPKTAVSAIQKLNPDVVTLDIQMPGKTGVEVVKELLGQSYFPVLMVSSLSLQDGSLVFDALNAGAFDYLQKPAIENRQTFAEELETKLIAAVEGQKAHASLTTTSPRPNAKAISSRSLPSNLLWCMGASTGGTQALTQVLTSLPDKIPATLIVQHIPPVFSRAFANSLNDLCPFTVKEAEDGETLNPNHVYIAAGGLQMGVEQRGGNVKIRLADADPVNRFKPSVDYMFNEVSNLKGFEIVAGLLTGMGRDGAQGLLNLKKIGANTFAQDEASSAVYGMPRAAVEVNAASEVVPLDKIAQTLLNLSLRVLRTG